MTKQLTTLILVALPLFLFSQGWQQLGDVPFLTNHSYGFGHEGKAYIIQGNSGNPFWEYNPDNDTWTEIGNFPGPRRGIPVGDDWNGKYYYGFGSGSNGRLNDLWVFDPADGSFTELPSCPCVGRTHPAFIAHNDKIMMGTGSSANGDLSDWWEYDMITQIWTQKQDIPGGDRHHPFFFSADSMVYFGGGHRPSWFKYNLNSEELTEIDNTPLGRVAGTQFNYNGRGFLLAGDDASHTHVPDFETFMSYDPRTEKWDYLPPLPKGSRWAPSSFIVDEVLYFFDGDDDDDPDDRSMWKFNLNELDCLPPTNLNASSTDDGITELFWNANDKVVSDTLKWRKVGETVWNIIPDAKPVVALSDLETCQEYEYQVISNCDSATVKSNVYQFKSSGCGACIDLDYCAPIEFLDFRDLFINSVDVNNYTNTSGDDNGYGNYEVPAPDFIPIGGNFNLSVTTNNFVSNTELKVWIDLDVDGKFEDSELLVDEDFASENITTDIFVPGDVLPGESRMRISYVLTVGNGVVYDACTTSNELILGEVEDYCIQLSETTNTTDKFNSTNIVAFPNPFQQSVRLKGDFSSNKNYSLKVLNLMGAVISNIDNFSFADEIDLSFVPNGIYFLQIEDEDISYKVRLVKQF